MPKSETSKPKTTKPVKPKTPPKASPEKPMWKADYF